MSYAELKFAINESELAVLDRIVGVCELKDKGELASIALTFFCDTIQAIFRGDATAWVDEKNKSFTNIEHEAFRNAKKYAEEHPGEILLVRDLH